MTNDTLSLQQVLEDLARVKGTTAEELRREMHASDQRVIELHQQHRMALIEAGSDLLDLAEKLAEAGSPRQANVAAEAAHLLWMLEDDMAATDPEMWA
ncbi:MAG TPA: hypothetical protein VNS19_23045 [Acidimicrobiales bacterium]|nr:hypothetical protein [Acidimicrobiales bacterium]